jgi:hypothetical protein
VPGNIGFGRVLVLPMTQQGQVSIRLLGTSGQWYNFNKQFHQFIANQTTWLSGTATAADCPGGCWLAIWISAAYANQNASVVLVVKNITLNEETPFLAVFVVPNDGVMYTQLGFTFGALVEFSSITLTDVLATSNSSILACIANTQGAPQMNEAPSSGDSGSPLRVCIFTKGQQVYYNAPAIGQCFCDKDSTGAACDVPALPVPYAPGRDILRAACGGFATNQGLGLARDGSLQPVNVDGGYLDGDGLLLECKCRDLGLVMRSTFLQSSPFSDFDLYRTNAAYGQPEFTDSIQNNTATNQVSPRRFTSDAPGRKHLLQPRRHAALHRDPAGRRELARDVAGRAGGQRAVADVPRRVPVGPGAVHGHAAAHPAVPRHVHMRRHQLQRPGVWPGGRVDRRLLRPGAADALAAAHPALQAHRLGRQHLDHPVLAQLGRPRPHHARERADVQLRVQQLARLRVHDVHRHGQLRHAVELGHSLAL